MIVSQFSERVRQADSLQRGVGQLSFQAQQRRGHISLRCAQCLVYILTLVLVRQNRVQGLDSGFEVKRLCRHDLCLLMSLDVSSCSSTIYGAKGRQPNTSTLSMMSMSADV